jgi:hypothetical protein
VVNFTPYEDKQWENPIIEKEENEKPNLLNKKKITVRTKHLNKPPIVDLNINPNFNPFNSNNNNNNNNIIDINLFKNSTINPFNSNNIIDKGNENNNNNI